MELLLPKGMKDFPPEEKIVRDEVVNLLIGIFERYGFNPLETPAVERFDVLSAKYAGGAEILKETFRLTDQGERDLCLRYDLTVPLARFVGMNPQLKMPFKRYAIGKVFRDGPVKLGRMREFTQCDCDVVGAPTGLADAECIKLLADGYAALGLQARIVINNRKLLEDALRAGGVKDEQLIDAMLTLDKIAKVGLAEVQKELRQKGIPEKSVQPVVEIADSRSTNLQRLDALRQALGKETEGFLEMRELLSYLTDIKTVVFDPSLSRGLAYYTGMVVEAFAVGSKMTSSLGGGGRYDKMIGSFLDSGRDYPAVGVSFGIEPIMAVLAEMRGTAGIPPARRTVVEAYVIPIKTVPESIRVLDALRVAGVRTEMDLLGRSISKNLEYASAMNIPYVVIVGKKELDAGKVKIRDMRSGKEELLPVADVPTRVGRGA